MNHEAKAALNLGSGWKMVVPTEKLVPQLTELSESKVAEFRKMLRDGPGPPLLVTPIGAGKFRIRDGAYRHRARILEGLDTAEVIVVGGADSHDQTKRHSD